MKVYHHKTVEDDIFWAWCGGKRRGDICNTLIIQENNVPGAEEFFYRKENYMTLYPVVLEQMFMCYWQ